MHGGGHDWTIEDIEVNEPKAGAMLVRWTHAGMCLARADG